MRSVMSIAWFCFAAFPNLQIFLVVFIPKCVPHTTQVTIKVSFQYSFQKPFAFWWCIF